jgi:hypothetical protein
MKEQTIEIFIGIGSAITGALFFAVGLGLISLVLAAFSYRANACDGDREFIIAGLKASQQNKHSNLCHSGGISNNAEWGPYIGLGMKKESLTYSLVYGSKYCLFDGDIRDNERANYVEDRAEGFTFDIHVELDL